MGSERQLLLWQGLCTHTHQQETATSFLESLESSSWEPAWFIGPAMLDVWVMSLWCTTLWLLSTSTRTHTHNTNTSAYRVPQETLGMETWPAADLTFILARLLRWDASSSWTPLYSPKLCRDISGFYCLSTAWCETQVDPSASTCAGFDVFNLAPPSTCC